jgi:hypothetical protein
MKMPKALKRLKISVVSSVDRAANPHAKITLFKRDDTYDATREFYKAIFRRDAPRGRPASLKYLDKYYRPGLPSLKRGGHLTSDEADERERRAEMFNVREMGDAAEPPPNIDDEAEFGESDNDEREQQDDDLFAEEGFGKSQVVSGLADLLCEAGAGEGVTRADALKWLLHDARGNSLVRRLHKARTENKREKETTMTKDNWSAIAKQAGGLEAICEHVISKGETTLSEHELTKLIADNAPRNPGESAAQAFSRAFTANDETGLQLRKAIAVAKGALLINAG